jgi:hypothetical protein
LIKKLVARSPFKDVVLKQLGKFGYLPSYFIPGVEKCGTTSLYKYMIQHPRIGTSQTKESFFFDRNYKKGLQWYKGFYQEPNCIDATPTYYRKDEYLKELSKIQPAKYIVILREPIARFESAWNMNLQNGWDHRSFPEIFGDEFPNVLDGYIGQGVYHRRLQSMIHILGRENIHVMFLENLIEDPRGEMNRVFNFLGLHQCFVSRLPPQKKGKYVKRLKDNEINMLRMVYDPANEDLSKLLGESLPW